MRKEVQQKEFEVKYPEIVSEKYLTFKSNVAIIILLLERLSHY